MSAQTRIVVEHFNRGQFPPQPFPLDSLSASAISSKDIRQVLDWENLMRGIEDIYLNNVEWAREMYNDLGIRDPGQLSPEWFIWKENFRRSIYQFFFMGEVLCRSHQEPLSESPKHLFQDRDIRLEQPDKPLLKSEEMAYLLKFPVFNFEDYAHHEAIYNDIAELFRKQTEHRPPSLDNPELLDAYPEDAVSPQLDRYHAETLHAEMIQCLLSRSFYSEAIALPDNPKNSHKTLLLKEAIPRSKDSVWRSCSPFMNRILEIMHSFSGQPSHYKEQYPTPPPPMQIFQDILRKYLGLRFSDDAFEVEDLDAPDHLFVHYQEMGHLFLDRWPELVPSLFDLDDGTEYEAYYS
ncbi:uncharacterized protein N7498_000503 [Penicillium cinerascens]|uniref:Uncharacterized protein n=1 Tax=Penicillium cinerascens TaxID=70096 RepID=A0A9W9TDG5_9EURO|nr:uncharacterized protein N7498_000503 [Penicillium cinerascens]KAJ5218404.1 hypothetical protein N7498_000503 [Penicillium cinerascens]